MNNRKVHILTACYGFVGTEYTACGRFSARVEVTDDMAEVTCKHCLSTAGPFVTKELKCLGAFVRAASDVLKAKGFEPKFVGGVKVEHIIRDNWVLSIGVVADRIEKDA